MDWDIDSEMPTETNSTSMIRPLPVTVEVSVALRAASMLRSRLKVSSCSTPRSRSTLALLAVSHSSGLALRSSRLGRRSAAWRSCAERSTPKPVTVRAKTPRCSGVAKAWNSLSQEAPAETAAVSLSRSCPGDMPVGASGATAWWTSRAYIRLRSEATASLPRERRTRLFMFWTSSRLALPRKDSRSVYSSGTCFSRSSSSPMVSV